MRLRRARIIGFQSFGDSGEIDFPDGINLIVGQNNAGKSALLRALQPQLANDRHRTPEVWEEAKLPEPEVQFVIEASGEDLSDALFRRTQSFIPIPHASDAEAFARELISEPQLRLAVVHRPNQIFSASYPSHGRFPDQQSAQKLCCLIEPRGGQLSFQYVGSSQDSVPEIIYQLWQRDMFYFSAERMSIGESGQAHAPRLSPNANNLPAVLQTLAGDRGDLFRKLIEHLREVFPTVGNLSVRPKPGTNAIEIRVWPTEAQERVELSFPLNSSGTGVSQVIALLTAIMTVENAVIVIDEISSFLHPAAVKGLLRILQTGYAHHQYIISTHVIAHLG